VFNAAMATAAALDQLNTMKVHGGWEKKKDEGQGS